jgi:putative FmdB family regulatory protein
MPTYEYQCQRCKKRHEAFQSITAKALSRCPQPKCGGRLRRLLGSGSGFLFKGSGFYVTDYRSKSYRDAKKKDQPASSSPPPSRDQGRASPPAGPAQGQASTSAAGDHKA